MTNNVKYTYPMPMFERLKQLRMRCHYIRNIDLDKEILRRKSCRQICGICKQLFLRNMKNDITYYWFRKSIYYFSKNMEQFILSIQKYFFPKFYLYHMENSFFLKRKLTTKFNKDLMKYLSGVTLKLHTRRFIYGVYIQI